MNRFIWPVRVYYEDTDSGGVVYYANYFKFLERARTEWLRSLGFEQDVLAEDARIKFMVRSVSLSYRRSARFNDLLQIMSRIDRVRGASLFFEQTVSRAGDSSDVLCSGRVRIACVDVDSLKPRPVPQMILTGIFGDH